MAYKISSLTEHFASNGRPKRILALDGGGLKGILTIGILEKIEAILRQRHGGGENFRLCHYFDLIAGTSTGAIIAATLAKGWSVDKIHRNYLEIGKTVFGKSLFRDGLVRAKYDQKKLSDALKKELGEGTTLGSKTIKTGLLIVTKRLDTGSPWPLSNNPHAKYYNAHTGGVIANCDYPLWKIVRASTAAPTYFDPERITIAEKPGQKSMVGNFVDGGMSCFNNPALQAFMFATVAGYRLNWPTGAEKLLLVSVGKGRSDQSPPISKIAGKSGIQCLTSLMNDCATMQETMLQWMSSSRTARELDREVGDLRNDLLAGVPLLTYLRYDADLQPARVKAHLPWVSDKKISELDEMDAPENMEILHALGKAEAEGGVLESDFPAAFDLGDE